jgi:predicted dehydrogenase
MADRPTDGRRVAIIGCGAVSEIYHLPALQRLGLRPALLVDRDRPRAARMAERFGAPAVSDDYRVTPDLADAAIVALPHHLHAPVARDLLARGVHVLVEKPMATSHEDCRSMVASARVGRAVLAVGLARRFVPAFRWIKGLVTRGLLGEIRSFQAREGYVFSWPLKSDFLFRPELAGGGVLLDTGSHTIDLLTWWLGHDIAALDYRDDNHGGVEADCVMEVTMASGARGTIELSRTRTLANSAVVRGSRGWIEAKLDGGALRASPSSLLRHRVGPLKGRRLRPRPPLDPYVAQIAHWLTAIDAGGDVSSSAEDAIRTIAFIERCYRERRPLTLPWVEIGEAGPEERAEARWR